MLDTLHRFSRDSSLFQFTTKRLRDFIDPKHLLIQIDERFDFPKLVEPLEEYYCREQGRPGNTCMLLDRRTASHVLSRPSAYPEDRSGDMCH